MKISTEVEKRKRGKFDISLRRRGDNGGFKRGDDSFSKGRNNSGGDM